MTPTMRRALEFFAENAGYSTPPGRMMCARDLARAEAEGSRRGWAVEWSPETDCFCREFDSDCECRRAARRGDSRNGRWECYCESAVLGEEIGWPENPRIVWLGSLGGICSADSAYRRVVSAELMLDALAGEWADLARVDAFINRVAA